MVVSDPWVVLEIGSKLPAHVHMVVDDLHNLVGLRYSSRLQLGPHRLVYNTNTDVYGSMHTCTVYRSMHSKNIITCPCENTSVVLLWFIGEITLSITDYYVF